MNDKQNRYYQEILNVLYHILDKIPLPIINASQQNIVWLDNQEVMQLLHISASTLLRWRKSGALAYVKVNGKIWYQEADVQKLLLNHS